MAAQLNYNDIDVSSDRLKLSDRIRELSVGYDEFIKNKTVSEEYMQSEIRSSIGSGGQLRCRVRKESNSTAIACVDLVSEDEYTDCISERDIMFTQLDCLVEELAKPLAPTIFQSLVEKQDSEVYKTSIKKRKIKHVEIDIHTIEVDTSIGAF